PGPGCVGTGLHRLSQTAPKALGFVCFCDGFWVTAHLRRCHEHRGRRPKAAKEGKRGEWGTRFSGRYGGFGWGRRCGGGPGGGRGGGGGGRMRGAGGARANRGDEAEMSLMGLRLADE